MPNDWAKKYVNGAERVHQLRPRANAGVAKASFALPATQDVFSTPKNEPFAGGSHSIVRKIATYVADGPTTKTAYVRIYTPSNRLRICATLAIEMTTKNNQAVPSFSTSPTWAIRAVGRNPQTGNESPLRVVYPPGGTTTTWPDAFEADSALKILQAEITIPATPFNMSTDYYNETCDVNLIVTWEPNIQIPEDELRRLYSLCNVSTPTPVTVSSGSL